MRTVIYTCDKCGKEIADHPAKITIRDIEPCTETWYGTLYQPEEEYCTDCIAEMIAMLQQWKPKKKAEKKTEEKKTRTKRIDRGKIKALRDAGWTIAKIAEEMDCSVQSVKNILAELKYDEGGNDGEP